MRHILTTVFLIVLLFPALALGETVKYEDLVYREGLYYKKFSDSPFTGKVTGKRQGAFKDGKKDGPWVQYHDNGQLKSKGIYRDGKENGPWISYNSDGTVDEKYTGTFKNGVKVK